MLDANGKKCFENSLRRTKLFLSLSGIRISATKWPKALEKLFDTYFYYFQVFWLYADVLGEISWLIEGVLNGSSFLELSLAVPCITVSCLATSKSIFLYLNRDVVVKVIDKLREIYPESDETLKYHSNADLSHDKELDIFEDNSNKSDINTDIERDIKNESVDFLNLVVKVQYYICSAVVVAFPLMPVSTMVFIYYSTGVLEYKYVYMVKYFFDPFKMALWPFVYFHQVMSTVIVAMNVFGSDTLFYAACIYIQMHFRILCHHYENAVSASSIQTRLNLKVAIRRHHELIDLVNRVEILYTKSTLFNIVTSSFLICLSGFIITMVEDIIVMVTFATFLFMNLSQISLLCYFGDMLMSSSTQIVNAIYNSLWYDADERVKKSVFLILIRAQKPCKLTACNFADLNLKAFTTILSRSWSYFALLKTMYK
ncbi:unnamed protein product [Chilo suppressalis]|uniref:Odorant receptor n=1 Tax=Chilo suppressalis TaxID=168631 RepID=A0ABN8B5G8_CHISP|nr:unnamed protein product [Chilo suppressalis]